MIEEIKTIEEMAVKYGPEVIRALESTAVYTGVGNIVLGLAVIVSNLAIVILAFKNWEKVTGFYDDYEGLTIIIGVIFVFLWICPSFAVLIFAVDPWNIIALYDPEAWAIHEIISSLKYN